MAKINLLPWRDELRRQKQQQFLAILGLTALGAALIGFLAYMLWGSWIENQNERNQRLTEEIQSLDRKIVQIENLEEQRQQLLTRKQIIEELQSSRSQTVEMLDALAQSTPPGVTLNSIRQQDNVVTLAGTTQSNARVSTFLQTLDAADIFKEPTLQVVEARQNDASAESYNFRLRVTLQPPASDEEVAADEMLEEGGNSGESGAEGSGEAQS